MIAACKRFVFQGDSMRPLLQDGDEVYSRAVESSELRPGDLAVYARFSGGAPSLIVHRLMGRREDGSLIFQGDSRDEPDEPVAPGELLGRAFAFRRGKAMVDLDSKRGRLLNFLGRRIPFLSSRLLFGLVYSTIVPALFSFAALFVLAFAAYGRSLSNGFVWDDRILIVGNDFVADPKNIIILFDPRFYLEPQKILAQGRPVFLASLLFDRALFGAGPSGFHLTNILLHAANAVLLFAVGASLGGSRRTAFLAGALFAVHPAASEAVLGVSFRADLLALFFSLCACLILRSGASLGAAGAWALALLSKPSAAVAALFFPAFQRERKQSVVFFVLAALLVGLFLAPRLRYHGVGIESFDALARGDLQKIGSPVGAYQAERPRYVFDPSAPPWEALYSDTGLRARTMAGILVDYAGLALRGGPLVVDRAPRLERSIWSWRVWGGFGFFLILIAGIFLFRGRIPLAAFGGAWFLIGLLPVSGLIPLYNAVAERYLYFSLAGYCLAAAALLAAAFQGNASKAIVVSALLAFYGFQSSRRCADWKDDESLFSAQAAGVPQSHRVPYNLAKEHWKRGRLAEAYRSYRKAIEIHPGYAEAWLNMGSLLRSVGENARAERAYERAVSLSQHSPLPAFVFGRWLAMRGEGERARAYFQKALEIYPDFEPAKNALDGKW